MVAYRVTITNPARLVAARLDVLASGPGEAVRLVARAAVWLSPRPAFDLNLNESVELDTAAGRGDGFTIAAARIHEGGDHGDV